MERVVKDARCLFCSLGCPCQVELGEPPWRTAPLQQGDGLCARAFLIGSLMSHPERANLAAQRRNGSLATVPVQDALAALAERLREPLPAAILVDGSYPTEAVGAWLRLAAETPDALGAVYLPASDEAMLKGLEAGGWTPGRTLGDSHDAVLVVGDAFSTHPPIARRLLDIKHAARGNQLLVASPWAGRTAAFATRAVAVPPGEDAALLVAVARALGDEVPGIEGAMDMPQVQDIAQTLRDAKAPAIILSQLDGTTANAHVAARAAARIAGALDAPLLPLFTYGNALGARQAAAENGAWPLTEVIARATAGQVRTLVVVGLDLLSALPQLGARAVQQAEFVAVAAPFPNATTAEADLVLPLGLWCEEDGSAQLADAPSVPLSAAAAPVRGALPARKAAETLSAAVPLDAGNREEPPAPEQAAWQVQSAAEAAGLTLIGSGDVLGFADGSLSQHNGWARTARPEPAVTVHPADARRLGLRAGARARVQTAAGEADLPVEAREDVPEGVAAVPLCFARTRQLFRWDIEPQTAAYRCGPLEVTLGPAR